MLTTAIDLLRKKLEVIEDDIKEHKYALEELEEMMNGREIDYLACVSSKEEILRAIDILVNQEGGLAK